MPNVLMPDGTLVAMPDRITPDQAAALRAKFPQAGGAQTVPSATAAPAVQQQQPGMLAATGGMLNRGAGALNRGVLDLLGIPADTIENTQNLLTAGYGTLKGLAGGHDLPQPVSGSVGTSEWLKSKLSPTPKDPSAIENILEGLPAGLLGDRAKMLDLFKNMAKTVPPTVLAQALNYAQQRLGVNLGPAGQQLAGLIGTATTQDPRNFRRPGAATDTARSVDEQRRAGIGNPSPGVSTGSGTLKGTEEVLGVAPGSSGFQDAQSKTRAAGMGSTVQGVANKLSTRQSNEQVGKSLDAGVQAFVDNFRAKQAQLYGKVSSLIKSDRPVQLPRFSAALQEFTRTTPGAETITGGLVNPGISKLNRNLAKDTDAQVQPSRSPILAPGSGSTVRGQAAAAPAVVKPPSASVRTIPYAAADLLRQRIGQELENSSLGMSKYPQAALKRLYGELTSDIEGSLGKGTPERKAWDRARAYTRTGQDRIENVLKPIADAKTPERALTAALNGTKEGASSLRRLMRSVGVQEADGVRANVIARMGKATPGAQSAAGDVFSVNTFMTNWNKLHPDAKKVIFSDPNVRADMENIAHVAEQYSNSRKLLYNPSGSGRAVAHYTGISTAAVEFLTGNIKTSAAIGGSMLGANVAARAMASPKFISWLSTATKATPAQFAQKVAQLHTIAAESKDPEEASALEQLATTFEAQR